MVFKNYIYARGREKWIKGKKPDGCVFCNIARDDPKTEKKVLYKDDDFMVIMNLFPYNAGHLQVVPVKHVVFLEDLKKKEYIRFFELAGKSVELLKKVYSPPGFNIGINMGGDVAGASVLHLHAHIVPRYPRDAGFVETTSDTKVIPETVEDSFKKLKKHSKMLK